MTQPSFSTYTLTSDFVVCSAPTFITDSAADNSWYSHQYYPLTYEWSWTLSASAYANRNLSYIILYFTQGVRYIESAWFRYPPSVINNIGSPKVGYSTANSQWYVNITNVQTSAFSVGNKWYLRIRLYATGSINYNSYLYNYNGLQDFSTSSGSFNPGTNKFTTSSTYGVPN